MPKIYKTTMLEVTPEQFLRACDRDELQELDLLLGKPEYQDKMNDENDGRSILEIEMANALKLNT